MPDHVVDVLHLLVEVDFLAKLLRDRRIQVVVLEALEIKFVILEHPVGIRQNNIDYPENIRDGLHNIPGVLHVGPPLGKGHLKGYERVKRLQPPIGRSLQGRNSVVF